MKPVGFLNKTIPPCLFKEVFLTIAPHVLRIVNRCLTNGVVPTSFKHVVVTEFIKGRVGDPGKTDRASYISKIHNSIVQTFQSLKVAQSHVSRVQEEVGSERIVHMGEGVSRNLDSLV